MLLAALCLAFALRLRLLSAWPLREDEALYGSWARSVLHDPRFLSIFPDKPPLFLWLQAVALALFGASSAAARLVSIIASTATVALVAAGARAVWMGSRRQRAVAAVAAALLVALNPFAIAFSATGYTDSLLVLWGTAAIVLALRGNALWAGIFAGAAVMTKQQGVFYLPLVFALVVVIAGRSQAGKRMWMRASVLALAGMALVIVPILLWDASRWQVAPSPWDLGVQNYTAIGFAALDNLTERLTDWASLLWFGAASNGALVFYGVLACATVAAYCSMSARDATTTSARAALLLLLLWVGGFLAAHLLSTVAPWDRYLLPIFPVLAMLLAGGVAWIIDRLLFARTGANLRAQALLGAAIALALVLQLPPAVRAAEGNLPIGADHGDYAGLDDAARWVEQQAAEGDAISVYHRALGWNLAFSLYDAEQDGAVDLRWFPNGVYLADNITKNPARRAIVIEPDWLTTHDLIVQAQMRGLSARQVARFGKMSVIEVFDQQTYCAWCVNRLPLWPTTVSGEMSQR